MIPPKILAFSASTRKESWNRKLVGVAAQGAAAAGADVTMLNLAEFALPIYNGDEEAAHGMPDVARRLYDIFKGHQGFLVSSPEYNAGFPGMLKDTLDWLTRPIQGEKPFAAFANKPGAIMAASPGAFGGIRMLPSLRQYLSQLQVIVLPQQHALGKAAEAFDESGNLKDEKVAASVKGLGERVAKLAAAMAAI